ncbi:MAG TPA: hypothetical protein PKM27_18270, partial [Saprospiraceae bacterium]|nr:hypothetical protein [Saprospiraceae bacterium]
MNFTRKAQLAIVFLFGILSTQAQRPEVVFIEGNARLSNQRRALGCPGAEAGTITITPNANNKSSNIQYLCYGDRLNIVHNRNAVFQDPKPLTTPGTGYVFYNCRPTVDGPTLTAVNQDPCVNRTSPIIVNGFPVHQLQGLWLAKGNNGIGDIEFNNDGFLQNAYNGGKPVQFWFAPITLDQFSTQSGVPQFETDANNIPGPCIDVNIDAAFSVVYLNEVLVSDITGVNGGPGNYTGTLTITGGLPEFDPNANYPTVHIENTQDPNILGMLTNGPATHGKPMTFSVPQPGRYFITVEDGNGCPTERYTVNIPADDGLLKLMCQGGPIGQEICIPINISKMPELAAGQFTLLFNPQAFDFVGARNLNPTLNTSPENVIVDNQKVAGILKFLWFDLNLAAHDFSMETRLVEFCFRPKGPPGNYDFRITGSPVALEFADIGGNPYPLNPGSGSVLTCASMISPASNLDAYYSQCGQTMFVSVFAAQTPISVKWEQEGVPGNTRIINLLAAGGRDTLFSNQPPARYFISVTDNTGINIRDTITFSGGIAPLTLDLTTRENASCKNNDGRVDPQVLGGTPGYRYEWSNGSVDAVQTRLSVGTYRLTVTDAQGCKLEDSVRINQSIVKAEITIQTRPTCPGIDNGVLQPNFSAITGIPPFTVIWEGQGTQIGNAFRNVGTRSTRLIVTDFRGCSDTAVIISTAQKQINIVAEVDNPRCFGNADGRLRISRSFSDGSQMTNEMVRLTRYSSGITSNDALRPAIFNDLNADRYNILVTDAS